MSFWMYVRTVEDSAVWLLLFALLTACVVRWRRRKLAIAVSTIFVLFVMAAFVMMINLFLSPWREGLYPDRILGIFAFFIAFMVLHAIGYAAIARLGWRRIGEAALPAAAVWPRKRLLLAVSVAVLLTAVTHWNLQLAVQNRLAREEVDAGVMALSVTPGRPIDSLNAAILYEPVLQRFMTADKDVIHPDGASENLTATSASKPLRRWRENHPRSRPM